MLYQTTKPTILIYLVGDVGETALQQLEFGIEEEGIPFQRERVETSPSLSLVEVAHQAAQSSPLSVGLAMDGRQIVLHYRNLQPEQFLYRISDYGYQKKSLMRILGTNAAKVVKGSPLIQDRELESSF